MLVICLDKERKSPRKYIEYKADTELETYTL